MIVYLYSSLKIKNIKSSCHSEESFSELKSTLSMHTLLHHLCYKDIPGQKTFIEVGPDIEFLYV